MHVRTALGLSLIVIALALAFLQLLADAYFLYFTVWWFDIPMHFLGGFLIGGAYLWFLRFEVPRPLSHRIPVFPSALAAVLAVGIAWEVFEYLTDSYAARNYALDTVSDILMDLVGMMVAYLFIRPVWHRPSH